MPPRQVAGPGDRRKSGSQRPAGPSFLISRQDAKNAKVHERSSQAQAALLLLSCFSRPFQRRRPVHARTAATAQRARLAQQIMAAAQRRGVRLVFFLRNLEYQRAELFRPVDAILVPSRYAQEHYQRTLGLTSSAIPGPWDWERVRCPHVDGRYVTFVNP